jgi:chromosome segregation and condensation protein ScpB
MARRPRSPETLDTELLALPPEERWRTWMGRVEAVIFAAPAPVGREVLARVVGRACNLALLLDDIRAELAGRPYELVAVAGGWQHRTKQGFAGAIQAAAGLGDAVRPLSPTESLVLMAIAYLQPITRAELGRLLGKEISRDLIGALRSRGFIGSGPRSPQPAAGFTLHLCDDKNLPVAVRVREPAGAAGYGDARGRRAPQQGQVAGRGVHGRA